MSYYTQLIPIIPGTRAYLNDIVSQQVQATLKNKCIATLRYLPANGKKIETPANLQDPTATAENCASTIWAEYTTKEFGSAANAVPQVTGEEMPAEQAANESMLPPDKAAKVQNWAANVTDNTDPNAIAIEPPQELVQPSSRRRVVAAESDDSGHEPEPIRQAPIAPVVTTTSRTFDTLAPDSAPTQTLVDIDSIEPRQDAYHDSMPPNSASAIGQLDRPLTESSDDELFGTEATAPLVDLQDPVTLQEEGDEPGQSRSRVSGLSKPVKAGRPGRQRVVQRESDDDADDEGTRPRQILPKQASGARSVASTAQTSASIKRPALSAQRPALSSGNAFSVLNDQANGSGPDGDDLVSSPDRSPSPVRAGPSLPGTFDVNAYGNSRGVTPQRGLRASRGWPSAAVSMAAPAPSDGAWSTVQGRSPRNRGLPQTRPFVHNQSRASFGSRPSHQANYATRAGRGQPRGRGTLRGRGQSHIHSNTRSSDNTLVDLDPAEADQRTAAPLPGSDLRLESLISTSPEAGHLLDDSASNFYIPGRPLEPARSPVEGPASTIFPGASRSTVSSGSAYAISRVNPGAKIEAMNEQRIAEMAKQRAELKALKSQQKEKLQHEDESQSRQFRRTMGQRAPNPAKARKPGQQQESKKAKDARIARTKAELTAEFGSAKRPSPKLSGADSSGTDRTTSTKKQPSNKSTATVDAKSAAAEDLERAAQASTLAESLLSIVAASRAFNGELAFEVQFGQMLMPFQPSDGQAQYKTLKSWTDFLRSSEGRPAASSSFTNILTTNGADADRILDMKPPSGNAGLARLWDRFRPGPSQVTYEFLCWTKDNEEFNLVVNEDRPGFEIQAPDVTLGIINLHYPAQIWDASATMFGTPDRTFPDYVVSACQHFVDTLYIPDGQKKIQVTYRVPTSGEITVRSVLVKRRSSHRCNLTGKHDFHLQITEVQSLYNRINKYDKKLSQGFVKDFVQMLNDGNVYYEISLIHQSISNLLTQNKGLELGELTTAWTESDIVNKEVMRDFLDLASHVISKIDGIGAKNIGTAHRMDVERSQQDNKTRDMAEDMSRIDIAATEHIRGVRGGKAEVIWDDGVPYMLGLGGARIPVRIMGERRDSGDDEIVPDDSASVANAPSQQRSSRFDSRSAGAAKIAGDYW